MKRLPEFASLFASIIAFLWSLIESGRAIDDGNGAWVFFLTLAVISFLWMKIAWKELNDFSED